MEGFDSEQKSEGPENGLRTDMGPPNELTSQKGLSPIGEPSGDDVFSATLPDPSILHEEIASGTNGVVPKKRKSDRNIPKSSVRSRTWRQRQKELDPEGFKEKERERTRKRRAKQTVKPSKETQTDISVSQYELLVKVVPATDSPGRYKPADTVDGVHLGNEDFTPDVVGEMCSDQSRSSSKMTDCNGDIQKHLDPVNIQVGYDSQIISSPRSVSPLTVSSEISFTSADNAVLTSFLENKFTTLLDDGSSTGKTNATDLEGVMSSTSAVRGVNLKSVPKHQNYVKADRVNKNNPSNMDILQNRISQSESDELRYAPHIRCLFSRPELNEDFMEVQCNILDIQTFQNDIYIVVGFRPKLYKGCEHKICKAEKIREWSNSPNLVTSMSISPDSGAIWYTRKDNSVSKLLHSDDKEMFLTNLPPKLLLIESSNGKETLYLVQNNRLKILDENGKRSGLHTHMLSHFDDFIPGSLTKDAVYGRYLATRRDISRSRSAILIDSSTERKTITIPTAQVEIASGCFDYNGDIILGTSAGIFVLSGSNFAFKQCISYPIGPTRVLCLQNGNIMAFDTDNNIYSFKKDGL
ncbi:uncharacterized protein [Argopecten irradians]|uniref:uncharacterized protein isoform X1 n=1 Tax=Argopecten irradians TaxID=31199 RepID=UPI003710A435